MGLIERMKERVRRPLREKFKSALPARRGDPLLLSLLGKVISRPGLAERAYGEGEIFLIKGGLFSSGVRLEESVLDGVGTLWKEDLGQRHYDPDAGLEKGPLVPHALILPHDFYMPLYIHPETPFVLRRERETLYLYLEDLRLFPVELERRPAYYSRDTSTGIPMRHVGVHRLRRQVLVEYGAYCKFFAEKTACLFCGIVAERPILPPRHQKYFAVTPAEVAEVVEAAYAEGVATEMQLTGGVLLDRAEVPYFIETGRALQERLGKETIPGSQAVLAPPSDPAGIEKLKDAGWEGVAFNLEVWDERLWPGIVPGKASLMSRERWLACLECAVEVFGKGKVASAMVAGLEPKRSYLAGVEWMAERGIYGVPIPWSPVPGSALEGHQSPTAAWHLEIAARTLDIWERHGLDPDRHSSCGLHYADLARMRKLLDQERREHPDRPQVGDLRYRLAVQGELPEV